MGPGRDPRRHGAGRAGAAGRGSGALFRSGRDRRSPRRARRPQDTDWRQIAELYGVLLDLHPSPVVELNRAVAVAQARGSEAGLRLLDDLEARGELRAYHLLPAARADLLRNLGRREEAAQAYRRALKLVANEPERRFLARRLAEVEDGTR